MMHRLQCCLLLLLTVFKFVGSSENADYTEIKTKNGHDQPTTLELPRPLFGYRKLQADEETDELEDSDSDETRIGRSHRMTLMDMALQVSVREGIEAMTELYGKIEPEILRNGQLLAENHPAAILSMFSAPTENTTNKEMAAYAAITATKAFKKNYKQIDDLARQAHNPKISLRRTALEGLCPPRDPPICTPASERYRTHDGTCNNQRRLRWGTAQMPFNRFLPPEYGDGVDTIRTGANNMPLSSSRFVSLLVHGAKDGDAPLTLMIAQWGQLLDHDMTSTAQPRSINGSVPSCCGGKDFHPSCFPIKVPLDDPWLAPLKVRCLEFLRSAPAQRRDCVLSWREQTNQATSFIDASPIYSSSTKSSDNARTFRKGLLIFGRGNAAEDVCQRGALARQCIRSGDGRSGEQPGLLALHQVWVGEHNRIATELSELNLHWSDEKIYQEARRIVGAMFQHITYREFLPLILGREVCKLFELDLQPTGYYDGYDPKTNPTVANSFAAAAFRFGHSLIQDSYMRCDRHHNRINNSVSLHEEFQRGDIGSAGSLHRLIRGLATQRALKRDEFISPELTNHLFQTPGFPFGLDLAAINIQRGRDHGIAPYTSWRVPCGLTPINTWNDFANIVGPESAKRIGHAYRSVHDIDLFVGGISERPVVGGLVGPTFACIIAQQFSNSRNGDRFWYENRGFESSFTPAQLHSLRRVSLAQVLCRTVGGGTFQPNIFIPHVFPGNERLPCGTGPLAPIDLGPWLEQDPFGAPQASQTTMETTVPDRVFNIISDMNSLTGAQQMKEDKTGFNNLMSSFVNNSTPQEQHMTNTAMVLQRPLNASKINDKLDFKRKSVSTKRPTPRPIKGVNNKLDQTQASNFNIKSVQHFGRPATTTRRTVVVNNIPFELRTATTNDTTNTNLNTMKKEKTPTRLTTDKKKKKNKNNAKNTNKLKGRADNVKTGQSKANLTPHKDIVILDEDASDTNLKTSKDEIVSADENIFAMSRENMDSTDTQIDFDSKTKAENEPHGDSKTHNHKDNMDILIQKGNTMTHGTDEDHSTTTATTTTSADGTNFKDMNIMTEQTSISNDIVEIEPLDSVRNSTQKNEQEINQQLKPEQKKTNETENNTNSQKDNPETKQPLKTEPKKTNQTEIDKNPTHKDNQENNKNFKMELKLTNQTENDKNSRQKESTATEQQFKMKPKETNQTKNETNTQNDNTTTEQRLNMEPKKTNETENAKKPTQKDDPETNENLKTEQKITNQTENDKNSEQKDDPATNQLTTTELKKTNETKNDSNSKKDNPETKQQTKMEPKKANQTKNKTKTQKDNTEPTKTNQTENDKNSTQNNVQENNENLKTKQKMTNQTEKDKHLRQKDSPATNLQIKTELKTNNQTEYDTSSQKENPESKHILKTETKKSNKPKNDTNAQKDNSAANQQTKPEPTKTNETENNKNSTRKHNSANKQQIKPEPTMTKFNETVSLTIHTKDIIKNQTEKQSLESLKTEQELNKFKLKLNTTSVTQITDAKQQSQQIPEQLKEDTDIDPLTHSSAGAHKRVQRKVSYSKTKTELRNVTNPKLLRVNITNQNVRLVTSFKLFTLKNRTASTTKIPKVTKLSKTTENSLELRQYPTRPIYTRPQKVILEGPHSDQYEIEINIRQTNRSPAIKPTLSYADYTTSFKPFGYDRYTNYADYQSTTPAYGYYQPDSTIASNFVQAQRTRPPTVIYLDEHDERTTTKPPSLLQNFLSFAASGFGVNRRPTGPSNAQKEKDKPIFSHNSLSSGGLTSTLVSSPHNSASSSQFGPEPQRQPIASSSFSQVGNAYGAGNGAALAASGAVSSGNFGSIMGIANANGADSTFSFNIRPRPPSDSSTSSLSNSVAGSYGLAPPRRPEYAQFSRPDYNNLPIASYPNEQYFAQQTLEASHSPFSTTGNKKPLQQSYFSRFAMDPQEKTHIMDDVSNPTDHKIDVHDFDYLSKTLEPILNGDKGDNDEDDSDDLDNDYAYDDFDQQDDDTPSKKFNRDGYIRPEFMIESLLKNQNVPLTNITETNNSSYLLDDNFVLPVLNSSKTTNNGLPMPIAVLPEDFNLTKTTTNPADSLPKHLNNDILAEDYDDDSNEPITKPKTATIATPTTTTRKTKTPVQHASFAPITILTKPERPDHWVIYETPVEKPLLPEIPEIKSDTFSALEVPMPFASLTDAWLIKYRNKFVRDREYSNSQIATAEDILTKTEPDVTKDTTDSTQVDDITNKRHLTDMDKTTQVKIKTDDTEYLLREDRTRTIPSTESTVHVRTDTKPERDLESSIEDQIK